MISQTVGDAHGNGCRRWHWIWILALAAVVTYPAACLSQNPFGDDDDSDPIAAVPQSETISSAAGGLPPNFHPVVRSLREHPPTNSAAYGKALRQLSRIEQWEEAARMLDELSRNKFSDADASVMMTELGLADILAMRAQGDRFTPSQLGLLKKIEEGAVRYQRRPEVLANALNLLKGPRAEDQKRGVLAIQSAGRDGLAFLVNSVMQDLSPPNVAASAVIASYGDDGYAAARTALMHADRQQRTRVFQLLKGIEHRSMIAQYLSGANSTADSDESRELCKIGVKKILGALPSADQARVQLLGMLQAQLPLLDPRSLGNELGSFPTWYFDGKDLIPNESNAYDRYLLESVFLSDSLRRCLPPSDVPASAALVALEHLGRSKRNIEWSDLLAELESRFPGLSSEDNRLAKVWTQAEASPLYNAQRLSILLMAARVRSNPASPLTRQLVAASRSGLPLLRYEATRGLMPLIATGTIHASEQLKSNIREMLLLQAHPLVLVIGGSDSLTDHADHMLAHAGVRSEIVRSGRDVIQALDSSYPIEAVVIVDRVGDVSLAQLVQRVRAHVRGSIIPIQMLLPEYRESEQRILNEIPGVQFGFIPPNEPGMMKLISNALSLPGQELWLLPEERTEFRVFAIELLQEIASQPMTTVAASVRGLAQHSRESASRDWFQSLSDSVLGEIGTQFSQIDLVHRITNPQNSDASRRAAADMLVRSVKLHGVRIMMSDVEQAYNAYNTLGRADFVVRECLGSVLDEIEIFAKENGWSSIPQGRSSSAP